MFDGSNAVLSAVFGVRMNEWLAQCVVRDLWRDLDCGAFIHLICSSARHQGARRRPKCARFPQASTVREYQAAIMVKHPMLKSVRAVMDGLKMRLQMAGNYNMQNNFYNEWTRDHYVSNVLVFAPDGRIVVCSWLHARLAGCGLRWCV